MSKGSAIVSILIAFVGGLAIGVALGGSGSGGEEVAEITGDAAGAGAAAGEADGIERYKVPVTDDQPAKGPADALVTIVEVSDFECPFCKRVGPTLSKLMNEYRGKVRIVWRNNPLPFHRNAGPAHTVAIEAFEQGGSEKFWEMHDKLFENQRALSREDLIGYAREIGLNVDQVEAALDNDEHAGTIREDQQVAQRFGARGTPHFFINGRKLAGAQPFEKFDEIVSDEIRRAEQLVETGVSKNEVYAALTRNAKTSFEEPERPAAADRGRGAQKVPDPDAVYKVPVDDEPMKGPENALVTIVEFSDFECPFCGRVGPTLKQIADRYGDDVRVVWKNNPLPFHRNAMPAAIAALEIHEQLGDDKFWAFHDKLFENQRALTRENLETWAQELGGVNMGQFRAALDNDEHKSTIEDEQQLARSLGASGTPAFFINGRYLRGAQPLPAFTKVIDEELAKAKERVQAGTPRSEVYAKSIENGATEPQFVGGGGGDDDGPAAARPAADQKYEISIPDDAPRKGKGNARVVIQEFSDFECPFCSRVLPTLKQIEEEYGNKVAIVWRNYPLPFHRNARLAHVAAMEIHEQLGDDKFWAFHDVLFENQRALSRSDLERYAQELGGVNMGQFRAALDNNEHDDRVQRDQDAIQEAGARIGTPSFFINGRLLQGAQPFPAFKAAIDRALEEG